MDELTISVIVAVLLLSSGGFSFLIWLRSTHGHTEQMPIKSFSSKSTDFDDSSFSEEGEASGLTEMDGFYEQEVLSIDDGHVEYRIKEFRPDGSPSDNVIYLDENLHKKPKA